MSETTDTMQELKAERKILAELRALAERLKKELPGNKAEEAVNKKINIHSQRIAECEIRLIEQHHGYD
jgi:hypothetical protein